MNLLRTTGALSLAGALLLSVPAYAQTPTPGRAREELLGYDAQRNVLGYVTQNRLGTTAFPHTSLVELGTDGIPRATRLSTDADASACRPGSDAGMSVCDAAHARVLQAVNTARARYQAGRVLMVTETPVPLQGCTRPPYGTRNFQLGTELAARVEVQPDGSRTAIALSANGTRWSADTNIAAITVSGPNMAPMQVPYNRIVDARELPGTDRIAVLLRSEACTPENTPLPVLAMLLPPAPPPERPLEPLPAAELSEVAVMHAVAPRARRRGHEDSTAWFEGEERITFDNAWRLPNNRALVQFTRHPVVQRGHPDHTAASFAILSVNGSRLSPVAMAHSGGVDQVNCGCGQEAFGADLDGDGMPEIVLRNRVGTDGEQAALLRWGEGDLGVAWQGTMRSDDRARAGSQNANVRSCTLGLDGQTLVVRCSLSVYAPGAQTPASITRTVQRIRWNGGAIQVTELRP